MRKAQAHYRQNSNIMTSMSIKGKDEQDYQELLDLLKKYRISKGEYFIASYRELDKGNTNDLRLKQLAWSC
jgi:hypothetical protein